MRVESEHDTAEMTEHWDLPLKEFLECFPPPQTGRIVDGYEPNIEAHETFGIPKGVVLNFHRKVNPNVPLSFRDTWGGAQSDHWVKVTLPIDFKGKFRLLPYDPASDDASIDHIFPTVEDLVRAFPVYAQANASIGNDGDESDAPPTVACGERLKLIRILCRHGDKFLECRPVGRTRLLLLRMNVVGNFTAVHDNSEYLLADLVCMTPRRRRVQVCDEPCQSQRSPCRIPGVPANFTGELFVEEPDAFVETTPADDPSVIIGVPHNLEMTVSTVEASFDRGLSLNNFATNNRNLFPVVARVTDWDEETAILQHHFVKPGVELVIHGWTRQSKVLAQSDDAVYAIPLTYQGKFRIKAQQFNGVYALERAHPGYKIIVLYVDPAEKDFPLAVGDILKVKRSDTLNKSNKDKEVKYLKCEKCIMTGTLRSKEVKLPMNSLARFEEVMEETKATEYHIKELVTFVADQQLDVELTTRSPDHKSEEDDLPSDKVITLCDFIVEPAVYVSVQVPDAPAFHIPLRTLIYVKFIEQLEKSASPLLTRQNPRLSTLDRCMEVLPLDVFNVLKTHKPPQSPTGCSPQMSTLPQPVSTKAKTKASNGSGPASPSSIEVQTRPPPAASAMYGYQGTAVDSKGRPLHAGSVSSLGPKSQSFGSKLKNKFRRHKSSDHINKMGKSSGNPAPLFPHKSCDRSTSLKSRFGSLSRHRASKPVLSRCCSAPQPVAHDSLSRRRLSNAGSTPPVPPLLRHRYIPHRASKLKKPNTDASSVCGSQISVASSRRSVSSGVPVNRPQQQQMVHQGQVIQAARLQGQMQGPRPQGQMQGPRLQGQMQGPRPQGQMQGPRPQGQMQVQRPQGQMQAARPQGQMQAPRPQGQMQAPRPQGQMQAPRPQGQMQAPRPQGQIVVQQTQTQVNMQGPRPQGQMDTQVPPPQAQMNTQVSPPQGQMNMQVVPPQGQMNTQGQTVTTVPQQQIIVHQADINTTNGINLKAVPATVNGGQTVINVPKPSTSTGPVTMNGPRVNDIMRSNSGLSEASRASTITASQRSVTFIPPGEHQSGQPGYMLMPVGQGVAAPPGYMLVPVMQPQANGGAEDEDFDDTASNATLTFTRSNKFKLQLPPDGNLYHFSVKKMAAFFNELRIDDSIIQSCIRSRMDGKKFSRLSEADLNNYGILNPITIYFRSKTGKRSPKFML